MSQTLKEVVESNKAIDAAFERCLDDDKSGQKSGSSRAGAGKGNSQEK